MQRLTIVTENGTAGLGVAAVCSFFEALNTTQIDSLQNIDDTFLNCLKAMKTQSVGFTDEYKERFLKLFEVGKKCLITDDWHLLEEKRAFLIALVIKCNEGKTLTEALQDLE